MRTTSILTILSMILGLPGFSQPDNKPSGKRTSLRSAAPFPWPLSADSASQIALVSREDVLRLLREIYPDADVARVGEFRFVPLVRDKPYLLVWHDAYGSRTDGVTAVYCEGNNCFHDALADDIGWKDDLVDVDGDGAVELIGWGCIAFCSGAGRAPIYTYLIYKFIENQGFLDYSAKAVDYYKANLLLRIEDARTNVNQRFANRTPREQAEARVGVQYVYDDYLRRVLGEKSAGLEHALEWVDSSDFEIRDLGFSALGRIPDKAAEAKLIKLSQYTDKAVAASAASFLQSRSEYFARREK